MNEHYDEHQEQDVYVEDDGLSALEENFCNGGPQEQEGTSKRKYMVYGIGGISVFVAMYLVIWPIAKEVFWSNSGPDLMTQTTQQTPQVQKQGYLADKQAPNQEYPRREEGSLPIQQPRQPQNTIPNQYTQAETRGLPPQQGQQGAQDIMTSLIDGNGQTMIHQPPSNVIQPQLNAGYEHAVAQHGQPPKGFPGAVPMHQTFNSEEAVRMVERMDDLIKTIQTLEQRTQQMENTCSVIEPQAVNASIQTQVDPELVTKTVQQEDEIKKLKASLDFLSEDAKKMRLANSHLRKLESKHEAEKLDAQEKLEQTQKELATLKKQLAERKPETRAVAKRTKITSKSANKSVRKSGPPLPRGWEITGLSPYWLAVENRKEQKRDLLSIGDKLDGVTLLEIDFDNRVIKTDRGTLKIKI